MSRQFVKSMLITLGLIMMFPLVAQESNDVKIQRNYMLVFDMTDYSSKLEDAVRYFFSDVYKTGDQLIIVTPLKSMGFSAQKLAAQKEKIIEDILNTLKIDINTGASRYRDLLNSMKSISESILRNGSGSLDAYIQNRRDLLVLRGSMQENLLKYAKIFATTKGENHLLMILQKELRPVPQASALNRVLEGSRTTLFDAMQAFTGEISKPDFDIKKVSLTFRYSKIRFHFLYLTVPNLKMSPGIEYIDNLGDVQSDLTKLSQSTNGVILNSTKPGDFLSQVRSLIMDGKVETEVVSESMEKE